MFACPWILHVVCITIYSNMDKTLDQHSPEMTSVFNMRIIHQLVNKLRSPLQKVNELQLWKMQSLTYIVIVNKGSYLCTPCAQSCQKKTKTIHQWSQLKNFKFYKIISTIKSSFHVVLESKNSSLTSLLWNWLPCTRSQPR